MRKRLLFAVLCAALPVSAQPQSEADIERSDFYIMGGALRALSETTWTAQSGFIYRPDEKRWGLGFAYNNDGHLTNNHRDGLAAQGWYVLPLGERFELQLGTGPYASMNNTTIDGERLNDFRLGLMTSAALKWRFSPGGWYFRTQYNNTWVPGSFNSNAVLFGLGRDFTDTTDSENPLGLNAQVSVWGGTSRTTQLGTQNSAAAYQLEAQYLLDSDHWWQPSGISVAFLSEGDTILAHRTGVPVQLWWSTAPDRITFSFGAGPYVAYDGARDQELNLMGILSLRAAYRLAETRRHTLEVGFMYTRVASFYNRDQDIFMLGLRLGGRVGKR